MLIIPLPWKIDELRTLTKYHEVFNVCVDDCPDPSFLIIQGNTLTWLQEGSIVGKVALQIRTRSTTMRKNDSFHADAIKNHGNVGFMGNFSSSTDAVQKIFPKTGHCISNSKFEAYSGQKLTGVKNHYTIIVPILCLLSVYPEKEISNLSTIYHVKAYGRICSYMFQENRLILLRSGLLHIAHITMVIRVDLVPMAVILLQLCMALMIAQKYGYCEDLETSV